MNFAKIKLTQGNLNNDHFKLTSCLPLFPVDSIGGGNKKDVAKRLLKIHPRGDEYVETDIDGEKKIFRKRSWVGAMFKRSGAIAGQYVSLQKDVDGSYQVWIDASEGK